MARLTTDKSSPVRVRIDVADLNRIYDLYRFAGVHGHISTIIREGTRLQTFIEEIERDRVPSTPELLTAIHTLRTALDRRDRGADGQGTEPEGERSAQAEEEAPRSRRTKTTSPPKATRGQRKSRKVRQDGGADQAGDDT